jgi:hypothetical protein
MFEDWHITSKYPASLLSIIPLKEGVATIPRNAWQQSLRNRWQQSFRNGWQQSSGIRSSPTIAIHCQTNFVGSSRRCHSYAGISLKPDLLWWGVCPGSERRLLIIRSPLRSAKAVWGKSIRRRTRSRPLAVWRAGRIFGSV